MFKRLELNVILFFTAVTFYFPVKTNDSADEKELKFLKVDFLNEKLPVINDTSDIVIVILAKLIMMRYNI